MLAERLGCPAIELDALFWTDADWNHLERAEFRAEVAELVEGDSWVIDGNYGNAVQDLVWDRADTVIWLDLPRRTLMRQVTLRTWRRVLTREELWNGCREPWTNLFRWDDESIIAWSWRQHPRQRQKYGAVLADPAYGHLEWVRLTSWRAVRSMLDEQPVT